MKPNPLNLPCDYPDNYGIVVPAHVVVVDVDPKNYEAGDDPFLRLQADLGLPAGTQWDTFTVLSRRYRNGHRGLHIYFRKPESMNLQRYRKDLYGKGIEIKTKGSFLVGPGSLNPDADGAMYETIHGRPDKLAPAPENLLLLFERRAAAGRGVDTYYDDEATRKRFIEFLATREPAVEGHGGDHWTMLTAMGGRDLGLPEEATFDLMMACWNDRCQPPWTPEALSAKVSNAYRYAKDAPGNMHPAAAFDNLEVPDTPTEANDAYQRKLDRHEAERQANIVWRPDGTKKYDTDSMDIPPLAKTSLVNVVNFFRTPHYQSYHNPLYQLLRYNCFTKDIEFTRRAPWHHNAEIITTWSDVETSQLQYYFSHTRDWDLGKSTALDGVIVSAQFEKYHPVVDYLQGLQWDGTPRVSEMLTKYAGAEDNLYTREVAKRFMIACIARIMVPGMTGNSVKHDHLLILEGKQGTGKSTFCKILGGPWYADAHIDPNNKDTYLNMLGKWVIELSEMAYNRKADVESMKRFMSVESDRLRLPYGRLSMDINRQCVFIATTNEMTSYMKDQTGNRRNWPVTTGTFRLDLLARDRDQLFAEARMLWQQGEPHHIVDATVLAMAEKEQMARTETDPWVDVVGRWIERETKSKNLHRTLSTAMILEDILCIPVRNMDRHLSVRVANTMRRLGWESITVSEQGKRKRGYLNPDFDKQVDAITEGL